MERDTKGRFVGRRYALVSRNSRREVVRSEAVTPLAWFTTGATLVRANGTVTYQPYTQYVDRLSTSIEEVQ